MLQIYAAARPIKANEIENQFASVKGARAHGAAINRKKSEFRFCLSVEGRLVLDIQSPQRGALLEMLKIKPEAGESQSRLIIASDESGGAASMAHSLAS